MSEHAAQSKANPKNQSPRSTAHTPDLDAEQDLELLQRALVAPSRVADHQSILYLQRAIGNRAVQRMMTHTGAGRQIQRLTYKGAPVEIDTIADANEVGAHIKRYFRLKQNKPVDDDSDYTYEDSDLAKLKTQQKNAQAAAVAKKLSDLVAALEGYVGSLATSGVITNPQPWNGTNPASEEGAEDFNSPAVAADAGTILAEWKKFLGPEPYSHVHPRTGGNEATRLISADGQRSIRYGNHEKTSKANLHHYHEETWVHDAVSNKVKVLNLVRRVPVT